MFSRVFFEFGTSHHLSSPLADDDPGDIGLQNSTTEEISCVSYFPLVADSPRSGAFAYTITSFAVRAGPNAPPLPTPSPPVRLTRRSVNGLASPIEGSCREPLRVSPSWANNGLCITGFPSTVSPTGGETISGARSGHGTMDNMALSQSDNFGPTTSSPLESLDQVSDDVDRLPDDFVGVYNVGYPLRPSEARYDLVGLGLPSSVFPSDRRERLGEINQTSPDLEALVEWPLSSLPSPPCASPDSSFLDLSTPISNDRELFVIAEAEDEDWDLPPGKAPSLSEEFEPIAGDTQCVPHSGGNIAADEEREGDGVIIPVPYSQSTTSPQSDTLPSPYSPFTISNVSPSLRPAVAENTSNTVHSVTAAYTIGSLSPPTDCSPTSVIVHDDVPQDLGIIERMRYRKRGPANDLIQGLF